MQETNDFLAQRDVANRRNHMTIQKPSLKRNQINFGVFGSETESAPERKPGKDFIVVVRPDLI